jgi:hypothetical protein
MTFLSSTSSDLGLANEAGAQVAGKERHLGDHCPGCVTQRTCRAFADTSAVQDTTIRRVFR